MPYLDATPLVHALRVSPTEFELVSKANLRHIPSRHTFTFDASGRVRIDADCDCSLLAIRPEQERELSAQFNDWQADYWRPVEINREFAAHFSARPALLRMLIALTGRLHRWLLTRSRDSDDVPAIAPQAN